MLTVSRFEQEAILECIDFKDIVNVTLDLD